MKLSPSHQAKLANIKRRTLANELVTDAERQWVLDTIRVCHARIPKEVVVLAQRRGFNVSGLITA